jgi:hypothetical protein
MPLPILAVAAISALVGAGVSYVLGEAQKQKLKDSVERLERQSARMTELLDQAKDNEIRARQSQIQILLRYYSARTQGMLRDPSVPSARFARLAAISRQLPVVAGRLLPDGSPTLGDREFVRMLQIAMNEKDTGQRLTRMDLAQLDSYLDQEQKGAVVAVMLDILAYQFREVQAVLRQLEEELRANLLEQARLEKLLQWKEDEAVNRARLSILQGRYRLLPGELEDRNTRMRQLRMQLVVLTILNDPALATPDDNTVAEIVERQLKGRSLSMEEEEFLNLYQVRHFNRAKSSLAGRKDPIMLVDSVEKVVRA